ncbi:MAG: amidohydrolase [Marinicella pacifica]
MNKLTITLIQTKLHWHNPEANRSHFTKLIKDIKASTDVIILPEMFTTGFTMAAADNAESEPGKTLHWMQQQAAQNQSVITGSLIIEHHGHFYNRMYWVEPNGDFQSYDKKHLFTYADEHHHFTAGRERLIIENKGWRICPLICYDLRFPVWSRNDVDYDLLIYIANWPAPRREAWQSLLKARAIENMAYVAGVNRIGSDGNDLHYAGDSTIYNAIGEPMSAPDRQTPFVETLTLCNDTLQQQRSHFGFLNDRDNFILK